MTDHKIGTREEWLAARLELLAAEKELTGAATSWPAGPEYTAGCPACSVIAPASTALSFTWPTMT
jgi:predicted dithiol-disulfide oxidoreductase (DUF899 family)